MRYIVSKKVTFDAAHQLPDYLGKCSNLHGHTWTVELGVSGPLDPKTGMVTDFGWLKDLLGSIVVDEFDHSYLNEVVQNPTAENIAAYIVSRVPNYWVGRVEDSISLEFVKVWESPDSCVEVRL